MTLPRFFQIGQHDLPYLPIQKVSWHNFQCELMQQFHLILLRCHSIPKTKRLKQLSKNMTNMYIGRKEYIYLANFKIEIAVVLLNIYIPSFPFQANP